MYLPDQGFQAGETLSCGRQTHGRVWSHFGCGSRMVGGGGGGLLLASRGERLGVRGTPCGARDGPNKGLSGLEVLLQTERL